MGRFHRNDWYLRGTKKERQWPNGDEERVFSADEEKVGKHLTCEGGGQRETVENSNDRLWVRITEGLNQNRSHYDETYLQMILPRDLL